jgi:hypothetical protein
MTSGDMFPLAQIDKGGVATMMGRLGGDPVVPSQLEGLLNNSALPMFDRDPELLHLFFMMGYGALEAFGTSEEDGLGAFHAGGYLYAATLAHTTPFTEVPLHPVVYEEIVNMDNVDFVGVAYRALYVDQAPLVGLITKAERALELDRERRRLAITGAGALHLVTKHSLIANELDTTKHLLEGMKKIEAAVMDVEHPELADLEAKFRDIDLGGE